MKMAYLHKERNVRGVRYSIGYILWACHDNEMKKECVTSCAKLLELKLHEIASNPDSKPHRTQKELQ